MKDTRGIPTLALAFTALVLAILCACLAPGCSRQQRSPAFGGPRDTPTANYPAPPDSPLYPKGTP